MKNIFKNNIKFMFGIIVGIVLSSTVIYASQLTFASGDVDHKKADGTTTTVESALNELYAKALNASSGKRVKTISQPISGKWNYKDWSGTIKITVNYDENGNAISVSNSTIYTNPTGIAGDFIATGTASATYEN